MATREILSLDTATPQIVAPQTGDTYSAPRAVAISPESLTGTSATTSLDIAQTWNTTGTPTAVKVTVTDTASNAASLLMNLQVGSTSRFGVLKDGTVYLQGGASTHFVANSNGGGLACNSFGTLNDGTYEAIYMGYGVRFTSDCTLGWAAASTIGVGGGSPDTLLSRKGAASLQLGAADAAAPVAQTLGVQSVVAGTSNTAGQNFTVRGSQGTGTGVGGDIIFQVASAGSSGTAQNTLAQAMRIYNTKTVAVGSAFTVSTLPAAGTQGRRAWVTDALAPTFLGTLTGGGAVISPVFDNGTAWVAG
jgi:hypothetical protein